MSIKNVIELEFENYELEMIELIAKLENKTIEQVLYDAVENFVNKVESGDEHFLEMLKEMKNDSKEVQKS